MKKLNLHAEYNKPFTYIVDERLLHGIYITTTLEYLSVNDLFINKNHDFKSNKLYRICDAVIVRAMTLDNTRKDFLITEDICFESLELISEHGFDGQFYDEFVEAFDMLETEQYDDDGWYG